MAVLRAWFGKGSLCQGLQLLLNLCEGGAKFFVDFLQFFLHFLHLLSMQIISPFDVSPKFHDLFYKIGGVRVVALSRRVVRSHRFTLGYWLAPGSLLLLRARISLLDFDLLLLVIVVTRSGGASRSQ